MAAIIGNRIITLGVRGNRLITACAGFGGDVFGCSPYDAATTAYLKATYPAYWNEIKAFGKSHPNLVPFVNEDNDLIVSLVEVGKVRGLKGDGVAYINSGYRTTSGVPFEIIYHSVFVKFTSRQIEGWNSGQWWGIPANGTKFGQNANGATWSEGALNEINISYSGSGGTPIKLNGTASGTPGFASVEFHAFHIVGWNNECMRDIRADITIKERGADVRQMIPFKLGTPRTAEQCYPQKACAAGTCGMIDLLTGTFYPNANTSGAFTIELTD